MTSPEQQLPLSRIVYMQNIPFRKQFEHVFTLLRIDRQVADVRIPGVPLQSLDILFANVDVPSKSAK